MNFLRQHLPLAIAFVVGMAMIAQYYVPNRYSQLLGARAADAYIIIQGIVLFLGVFSLLHVHIRKTYRRESGWGYSVFMFAGIAFMLTAGFWSGGQFTDPETKQSTLYDWAYANTMVPLGATLFSVLAFFIASAAFRAFRARSLDATLLLATAVVVLFALVPWGGTLLGALFGPDASQAVVQWIMEVPTAAAFRGILLGVGLGIIATSLKIIFGIERSYLGGSS